MSATLIAWFKAFKEYVSQNKTKSAILAIPVLFAGRWIYYRVQRSIYSLPPGPIGLPIFGSALQFHSNTLLSIPNFHTYLANTYGPITMYSVAVFDIVLISDCKIAKQVIRKKNALHRWDIRFDFKPQKNNVLGILDADDYKTQALILISRENWARRRKILQNIVMRYLTNKVVTEIMNASLNGTLVKYLNENVITPNILWSPKEILQYITMNTIFISSFGYDEKLQLNDELYNKLVFIIENSLPNSRNNLWFRLVKFPQIFMRKKYERYQHFQNAKNTLFKDLILTKMEKYKEKNENEPIFLLDEFVRLINENKMTIEEAYIDLYLLFFAGTHTTTHTSDFGTFLIAKNEGKNGIIDKIRKELLSVMKEINVDTNTIKFDLKKVNQCPLFRAFVYEVMRISSVVPRGLGHLSDKDIWVTTDNGYRYRIPAKATINYNTDYIQRISEKEKNRYWKAGNGDTVYLENWLKKYEDDNKWYFVKNEGFINFGSGRRDCVGKSVAIKELYCVLGFFILNYKFSFGDGIDAKNVKLNRGHSDGTAAIVPEIKLKVERIEYN